MGNEESSHSGEEPPPVQRVNSKSRASYKNNVYAEIYESAVSTVNEAANTIASFEPVSQGLDILSDAANVVTDIAGQGFEVVTKAVDDLIDTLDEVEETEGNPIQKQQRTPNGTVEFLNEEPSLLVDEGEIGERRPIPSPSGATTTTSIVDSVYDEDGVEVPQHRPVARQPSQPVNHLKSRASYKNTIYSSIFESASETLTEAANFASQIASEGIDTVSKTIDELMEDTPEAPEHHEAGGEEVKKVSSSSSEPGEDVFQYVSGLISTGVAEVANQIDYESISNTILKAVQDINEVLGTEADDGPENTPLPNSSDDLINLPDNPYVPPHDLSTTEPAPAVAITEAEAETID